MKNIIFTLATAIVFCGCITDSKNSYTHDELDAMLWYDKYSCAETGVDLLSRNYVPLIYDRKIPLVVFLHGAGQKGTDNTTQLYEGDVGKIVYYSSEVTNAVVAVPQCPPDSEWTDEKMIKTLDSFVSYMTKKVTNIDTNRIYLIGFSMGGIGSCELARYNSKPYAAVVPICGGWRAWWKWEKPVVPDHMLGLTMWVFSNYNDEVVDNLYGKYIVGKMWDSGNRNAHYTEGDKGHFDEYVFDDTEILDWVFKQAK